MRIAQKTEAQQKQGKQQPRDDSENLSEFGWPIQAQDSILPSSDKSIRTFGGTVGLRLNWRILRS